MNPIEAYLVIKAFAKISNVTPNTALKYCAKYAPLYLSSLGTTEEETVISLNLS